jgi:hypothetical protein
LVWRNADSEESSLVRLSTWLSSFSASEFCVRVSASTRRWSRMRSRASVAIRATLSPTAVTIAERLVSIDSCQRAVLVSICCDTIPLSSAKLLRIFSMSCRPSSPSTMARVRSNSSALATLTLFSMSASFSAMRPESSCSRSRTGLSW